MIKAIIFDFDGTLTNRKKNAYDFYKHYLRDYFKDFDDVQYEAVLQDMLVYDCNGIVNIKFRTLPFIEKYKEYLPEDYSDRLYNDFYQNLYQTTVLKPETLSILEKLKKDYKIAILSNGQSSSQHDKINHVLDEKYFDVVMVSGDIGIHKPDTKIFDMMAQRLGVKNEECLMIGDVFSTDILGASKANMVPVWMHLDTELPSDFYKGYRIEKLEEIFTILDKENNS